VSQETAITMLVDAKANKVLVLEKSVLSIANWSLSVVFPVWYASYHIFFVI